MPFAACVSFKVPIVTYSCLRQLRARAFTLQITNAKGKVVIVIIIQDSRSGEVDQMNIEDSCRLFLSKVALLNTVLPVHCCDGWGRGEKRQRAAPVLLGGGAEHP